METKKVHVLKNCSICLSDFGKQLVLSQNELISNYYKQLCGECPLPQSRVCCDCSTKLQDAGNFQLQCKNSREILEGQSCFSDYEDFHTETGYEQLEPELVFTVVKEEEPEVTQDEDDDKFLVLEESKIRSTEIETRSKVRVKKKSDDTKVPQKRGRKPRPRKPKVDRSGLPCRDEVFQTIKCSNCEFIAVSVNQLTLHARKAHRRQPMTCPLCSFSARSPCSLMVHFTVCPMRPEEKVKPEYKCPACGELVVRFHNHIETCHSDLWLYECHYCQTKFMQRSAVWSHLISVHSTQSHNCHICGKLFKSVHHVKHHQRLSHGVGTTKKKCRTCDYETFNAASLRIHENLHTSTEVFVCEVCSKSFRTQPKLARHLLCHTDGKPHNCTECTLTFKTKRYLQTHMRVHKPPGKYSSNSSLNFIKLGFKLT